jgi:LPXTG-motif cell wall-anchored protein
MNINRPKFYLSTTSALVLGSLFFPQAANAVTVDAAFAEMNFGADNGAIQSAEIGTNAGLGFTHRYEDVLSGVDAIATVIGMQNLDSDDNQTSANNLMDHFDDSSSSGREIDLDIDIFGDPGDDTVSPPIPPEGNSGFVTFRIDFVAANTNNAVTIQNVGIVVDDIDSNQFAQFAGITAYELSATPPTELTVTSSGGAYEFNEPIGSSSSSSDEENWVAVEYSEASSITITLGARESGGASFGVSFVDTTWTETPSRVTPALTAYTLSYNANDATSGSVPSDQDSTVNSSTVTLVAPQGNLVKNSCSFGGWNTRQDGTGANYLDTESITMTAATTLYAKWNCSVGGPAPATITPTATLATTGANVEWLPLASVVAVVAGAGFFALGRRKRTE